MDDGSDSYARMFAAFARACLLRTAVVLVSEPATRQERRVVGLLSLQFKSLQEKLAGTVHPMSSAAFCLSWCDLSWTHDKLQVDSAAGKAVAASLEAACCCLQLLAASGLPNSLYLDELLTAAVQMTKYQLQFNVLAFLHLPYRQLYRPSAVVAGMIAPALVLPVYRRVPMHADAPMTAGYSGYQTCMSSDVCVMIVGSWQLEEQNRCCRACQATPLHSPLHARYCAACCASADAGQITAVKKRARVESASRMPPMMKSVQAKLELLLCLLAQVR